MNGERKLVLNVSSGLHNKFDNMRSDPFDTVCDTTHGDIGAERAGFSCLPDNPALCIHVQSPRQVRCREGILRNKRVNDSRTVTFGVCMVIAQFNTRQR